MEVVRDIADRVVVLHKGEVVETGEVWSIFSKPQSDITRNLVKGLTPILQK